MSRADHGARLGVVVVNYDAHRIIEHNLRDLDQHALAGHVIIVDNYSHPNERRDVEAMCRRHDWSVVPLETNEGFGAGVNAGAARAVELGCTSLLLLNPDAAVDTSTARQLLAATTEQPMTVVAPRIMTSRGDEQAAANQVSMSTGQMRRYRLEDDDGAVQVLRDDENWRCWLSGACLAVSIELWGAAGRMADDYFLYWEDVDFSLRCRRTGARLVQRRDLFVVHDEGGTQERRGKGKSNLYYFYNCRSRLLFARRNVARRTQWRWALTTPRESWRILMRGGRRQLLHSRKPLVAALLGTLSGLLVMIGRSTATPRRVHEMVMTG